MSERIKFARHLRRQQTDAETIFWEEVRGRRFLKLKFKRQVPISKYFADFVCESEKLVVEIDDSSHQDKKEYDQKRSSVLQGHGYRVIRFTNEDVYDDIDEVMESLSRFVGQS